MIFFTRLCVKKLMHWRGAGASSNLFKKKSRGPITVYLFHRRGCGVLSRIVRNCWNLLSQNGEIRSNYRKDVALDLHLLFAIMRAIKIIKQKQNTSEAVTEDKKKVEPNSRNIANTVKSWIAESQERRRNQRRSLAALGVVILIAFAAVSMAQSPAIEKTQEQPIKVTIATTDGFLGPTATRYKVGEQIPVTITMTNTSKDAVYTCISSDLYQDRPQLTRDGKPVPYTNWQSYETVYAKRNRMCEQENLPEPVLLRPNEPRVADWFVLVADSSGGADAWYDSLPAGKYELSIQRRLSCCDGPMVESNKVSFEVTP